MQETIITDAQIAQFYEKVAEVKSDDYVVIGTKLMIRQEFLMAILNKLKRTEQRLKELQHGPQA